jgi:hypothetical protein
MGADHVGASAYCGVLSHRPARPQLDQRIPTGLDSQMAGEVSCAEDEFAVKELHR